MDSSPSSRAPSSPVASRVELNTSSTAVPPRQPIYIFFTLWGLTFLVVVALMFSYGLVSAQDHLIAYAGITGMGLLFVIFTTHDNINGVRIASISQHLDLQTGEIIAVVTLKNEASTQKKNVFLKSWTKETGLSRSVSFQLQASEECQVSLKQPFGPLTSNELERLQICSTYPFGLLRSWIGVKTTARIPQVLPPHFSESDTLLVLKMSLPTEPTESITLQEYRGGGLSRIDWKRYSLREELWERAFEVEGAAALIQKDPHVIDYDPAAASNPSAHFSRIYGQILLCLRHGVSFEFRNPREELNFSWVPFDTHEKTSSLAAPLQRFLAVACGTNGEIDK